MSSLNGTAGGVLLVVVYLIITKPIAFWVIDRWDLSLWWALSPEVIGMAALMLVAVSQ